MDIHVTYICVGSNLGNKLENCRNGIAALTRFGSARLLAQSRIYKTEPVDFKNQDWFVNYAVKLETALDPFSLLSLIKSFERAAGRVENSIRFGPRVLDLDIILYDEIVIDHPRLVIPHPKMHKRRFVLKPICDIDPNILHPLLHRNMQALLDQLQEEGQRIIEFR